MRPWPKWDAHDTEYYMESYKIYTVEAGTVKDGAQVGKLTLKGAGITIPAIVIGEEGRGRSLGVLPVEGAQAGERIHFASLSTTRSGRPKLVARPSATTTTQTIVVFRTHIGYRGSNCHSGDQRPDGSYEQFPGRVLARGIIAQGIAGRMGSGDQLVALIDAGVVFRTGYSGRLYGQPEEHFYTFNGEQLLAVTREEREATDLF